MRARIKDSMDHTLRAKKPTREMGAGTATPCLGQSVADATNCSYVAGGLRIGPQKPQLCSSEKLLASSGKLSSVGVSCWIKLPSPEKGRQSATPNC
jgi:hypothetical protein